MAALIVATASYTLTGGLLCWEVSKALVPPESSECSLLRGAVLSLLVGTAVMIMQPIVGGGETQMYRIGYIWAEPYYSPTCALMKAFSFISTMFAVTFLRPEPGNISPPKSIVVCALATAAGTLAKPSFAICMVPALLVLVALRFCRSQFIDLRAITLGLLAPAVLVLAVQYHLSFSGTSGGAAYHNSVIFAPLAVMKYHSKDLVRKFVSSIAFPLAVYVLYWARARRDTSLNFAFLLFGFGISYTYLLSEKLNGWTGNFLWSSYIGLFMVFVFAVVFYVRQVFKTTHDRIEIARHVICFGVLMLHVRSGILTEAAFLHARLGGYGM
jgi:hypothetical protein